MTSTNKKKIKKANQYNLRYAKLHKFVLRAVDKQLIKIVNYIRNLIKNEIEKSLFLFYYYYYFFFLLLKKKFFLDSCQFAMITCMTRTLAQGTFKM